ncbi:hypothetical protein HDU79_007264 [Rhizoclosmatium sp. JEL0117]|nr:hypothetical protein HDU79_007264 [Rhizoclosmatium sp. JEL0117]
MSTVLNLPSSSSNTNCSCHSQNINASLLPEQIQLLQDEIQEYRQILGLPPKQFSDPNATPEIIPITSTTRSLSALPTEVLSRIVPYLDFTSIIPFCHSLRPFKHISTAIYNVGTTFKYQIEDLWPVFHIPEGTIPVTHLHTLYTLSKLLNQYGGRGTIHLGELDDFESVRNVIPRVLEVTSFSREASAMLMKLDPKSDIVKIHLHYATLNKELPLSLTGRTVRRLETDFYLPQDIVDVLPTLKGFSVLAIRLGQSPFPCDVLGKCVSLKVLVFENPQYTVSAVKEIYEAAVNANVERIRFSELQPGKAIKISEGVQMEKGWTCVMDGFRDVLFQRSYVRAE